MCLNLEQGDLYTRGRQLLLGCYLGEVCKWRSLQHAPVDQPAMQPIHAPGAPLTVIHLYTAAP